MINVLSTTDKYILQPSLLGMHKESNEWLSSLHLWKRELSFFQKLLEMVTFNETTVDFKKQVDHYQNLIIYYDGELIDGLIKKLRTHEARLAKMLKELNESDVAYYKEHKGLINEIASMAEAFTQFKKDFFLFIEKYMKPNQPNNH